MPVRRGLQRVQLWNTSGYVCHSCRYKLLLGQRQLTRSQTNLSTSEGSGEDWFSNFNDLTELEPTKKKVLSKKVKVDSHGSEQRVGVLEGPSNGSEEEQRGREDADAVHTSVAPTDALSHLESRLENNLNSKSKAYGSPSFSRRPSQWDTNRKETARELVMRKRAKVVRDKLTASKALENAESDESTLTELSNAQDESHIVKVPPWYPNLHVLAAGVARNGIRAEAKKIADVQMRVTSTDLAWRHMFKSASTTRGNVESNIAAIMLKAFHGVITALDRNDGAASVPQPVKEDLTENATKEEDVDESTLEQTSPYSRSSNRLDQDIRETARQVRIKLSETSAEQDAQSMDSSPTETPNDQKQAKTIRLRPYYPSLPELAARVEQSGLRAEVDRITNAIHDERKTSAFVSVGSRTMRDIRVDVERRIGRILRKALLGQIGAIVRDPSSAPVQNNGQEDIKENVMQEQIGQNAATKRWNALDDLITKIETCGIESDPGLTSLRYLLAAKMARTKIVSWRAAGKVLGTPDPGSHGALAKRYEQHLKRSKGRLEAAAIEGRLQEEVATQLADITDQSLPPMSAASVGGEDEDEAVTYNPMGVNDGSEELPGSQIMTSKFQPAQESSAVSATDSDKAMLHFEATLQQLLPEVDEILSKAREAHKKAVKAPEDSYGAVPELMDAVKGLQKQQSVQAPMDDTAIEAEASFDAPINDTMERATAAAPPQMPSFGSARNAESLAIPTFPGGTFDSVISPLRGERPPPPKPIFEWKANPFASSPTSPLSRSEPLSLAQQVYEADDRPKWGGVVTASAGQPSAPASAVTDTTSAEVVGEAQTQNFGANASFRPFGLGSVTPSEGGCGNSRFLNSLQKATRFDAEMSSQTSYEALSDGAKNTETSGSTAPLNSTSWSSIFPPRKSNDIRLKQSKGEGTSVKDLHQLQQRLNQEMLGETKPEAPAEKTEESSGTLVSASENATAETKPIDKFEDDQETPSASTEGVSTEGPHDKATTSVEASSISAAETSTSSSDLQKLNDQLIRESPSADVERAGSVLSHRPLSSENVGALAEFSDDFTNEATAASETEQPESGVHESSVNAAETIKVPSPVVRKFSPTSTKTRREQPIPFNRVREDGQHFNRRDTPDKQKASKAALSANIQLHDEPPDTSAVSEENRQLMEDHASQRLASLHVQNHVANDNEDADGKSDSDSLSVARTHTVVLDNPGSVALNEPDSTEINRTAVKDEVVESKPSGIDSGTNKITTEYIKGLKAEIARVLGVERKLTRKQKIRLEETARKHLQAAARGDHIESDGHLARFRGSLQLYAGQKEEPLTSPYTSHSQSTTPSAALEDSPGGSDSAASGGNGNGDGDDGDDKPLWEVMSKAAALTEAKPAVEEKGELADPEELPPLDLSTSGPTDASIIKPMNLEVKPLGIPQPPVPGLEYGLDRVLFNPGVYQLQDPLSRVYNFDPYLQKIMPVVEFDFNALKEYKTSSQDTMLSALAKEHGKRYIGSTSSMTGMLGHFHYLLSNWRPLNLNMLSRGFTDKLDTFTLLNRAPTALFLRWKNGTYAIDADKQYDSGNVLMLLGKSMEKLLTTPTSEFERYRKSDPRMVSEEERTAPEAFEFTTMGDFLMRSQLDAHDPRLPGTGMFDLKTRAVLSVRMDSEDFQPMTGYEIHSLQGRFGSYEREFYDMTRSTMLKYMLQARMGRMDGIFIAYHNVERIFGFQYLPIPEMDRAIHGQVDRCLGDQEFKTSLDLVNKVFDKAAAKFPQQSLRFHFEATTESLGGNPTAVMWIFAEPMTDLEIDDIQSLAKAKVAEFERTMMGIEKNSNSTTADGKTFSADKKDDIEDQSHAATSTTSSVSSTTSFDSAQYISSNSAADPSFLNDMATSSSMDKKPLFAASLICRSRVNGIPVQRPEGLKATDSWEVEYLLREWDASDVMWAKYEQMKARRQDMYEKLRNEEEMGEGNGNGELTTKQKRERAFIDFLRSMSQSGREFRNKIEQLEAGKEPVIVGQPIRAASQATEENIATVDQYTAWLYGKDRS